MIALIGIKRNIPIQIREAFTIKPSKKEGILKALLERFDEAVLLSTCNRTEIYFNDSLDQKEILKEVFEIFGWEENLKPFVFYAEGKGVSKHLFEVSCGYHSKIRGEDQILGQIKSAYADSMNIGGCNKELGRLFQEAITCGKEFRTEAKLYEIPVSSVSIVTSKIVSGNCKRIMVIGHGEVGELAIKYLISHRLKDIYVVVRHPEKLKGIYDDEIKVIDYKEKEEYINDMDCIISCTNAPHTVISKKEISERGKKISIFDMAIPRDVDAEVGLLDRIKLYNIDELSEVDDGNKELRVARMKSYRYIIDKYVKEYDEWISLREISSDIRALKEKGESIYSERLETYNNKSKSLGDEDLVKMLLKSTSDAYINKAIEVLKDEKLKGCEDECLRIIKKIFLI